MATLLRLLVNGAAVWAAIVVVDGLAFRGPWPALFVIALAMATVNAFVRPLAHIFSVPLRLIHLGVFIICLNALALALVLWASESLDLGLVSTGVAATTTSALVLGTVSWIMSALFSEDRRWP